MSPAVLRQNDNGTLGPNRPQIIEELDAPWEERILAPIIRLGSPIDDDEPPRAPTPEQEPEEDEEPTPIPEETTEEAVNKEEDDIATWE